MCPQRKIALAIGRVRSVWSNLVVVGALIPVIQGGDSAWRAHTEDQSKPSYMPPHPQDPPSYQLLKRC